MNVVKKLHSFIDHPISSIRKILDFIRFKPRFGKYYWSDRVKDAAKITCRHVFLGEDVYLGPRCRIQGIENYLGDSFNPKIYLRDGVSVQQDFYLTCASKVDIGENTAIAAFVTITDIDHPYVNIDLPIENQRIKVHDVYIGSDCKIYNGAVITCGTRIGKHCVVGANSVVKGEYPDYCVIVGNPSRIVKRYNPNAGTWQSTDAAGNFINK